MEIHYIQKLILMDLAETKELTFSGFKRAQLAGITKDLVNYHLKELIKAGYIKKVGKVYLIENKGKHFVSNLDFDNRKLEKLPKVSVMVGTFRKRKGKTQVLLAKRMKAPFLGSYSFITGKVRWGDSFEETAKRELTEETGLVAEKITQVGIERLTDLDPKTGEVLMDVLFIMFKVNKFSGKLVKVNKENENVWVDLEKIEKYNVLPAAQNLAKGNYAKWEKIPYDQKVIELGRF